MTVYSTDSFASAFGTTDGAGSKDPLSWTQHAGSWSVSAGKALTTSVASARATVDSTFADVTVYTTISTVSTSQGIVFRANAGATDYILFAFTSSTAWSLSTVGTTPATLTSGTLSTALASNAVLKIVANGTSIRAFVNDTQVASVTSSTYQTNTRHGIYASSSTATRFDSFEIDNPHVVMNFTATQTETLSRSTAHTVSKTAVQTPTITRGQGHGKTISVTNTQTPASVDALPGNHPVSPTGNEYAPTFAIKIVNMRGTVARTLTYAEPDTITWTLNQPDEFTFHFPKGAYSNTEVAVLQAGGTVTEAQIYRNDMLMTWGPIVQLHASGKEGKIGCEGAGADWYLNRRFLDGTIRNFLTNPDFESGLSSWTTVGSVTATSDTSQYQVGAKSAKLVNATGMNNAYLQQTITMSAGRIGTKVIVSGWFFIESFTSMANQDAYGLYMEGYRVVGAYQGNNYWPIDSATPRNQWVKASFSMWIPPNETWVFNIRCYAPGGTIYYDDLKAVVMESVSTEGPGPGVAAASQPVDLAEIVRQLVNHVQRTDIGKSNLNIGVNPHGTGLKQVRSYQYVDHVQFDTAMREFIERDDGFDYFMDYTPTTRTFYQLSHKRGLSRTGSITLKFRAGDSTSNCVDYDLTDDGGAAVTHETYIGDDNGPDREQGEYTDTSNMAGIVLEDVRQAPQGSKTDSLLPFARDRVKRYSTVPRTLIMHVKGDTGYVNTLGCGDLVHIDVNDGWTSISANYRITTMTLDCNKNILAVTVTRDDLS